MGEKAITPAFGDPTFEEQLARYHFVLPLAKEKCALDVGCGTGFGSCALATVAYQVTAVDSDSSALEFARKNYKHPRIDFVGDDVLKMKNVRKKFDIVTSFGMLERFSSSERDEFLRHLSAHVLPTGVAILSLSREKMPAQELKLLALRHFGEVQMLGQVKSRGPVGNLLFRLGLVGEIESAKPTGFSFQPLMYWRPEVGWGESERFVFAPSLWRRTESLLAICRNPRAA
jgi:SAM-dependent methyltransferase